VADTERETLTVEGLRTEIRAGRETVTVVDGVDFEVRRGATLAIVGESGSGKTITALSLLRLLPPVARIAAGSIRLAGRDLTAVSDREIRAVRGNEVGMMFQNPMTALNPGLRIGQQIAEPLAIHGRGTRQERRERARSLLEALGLPDPELILRAYPHQLSGGMRQRVCLAASLSCDPEFLIADEPTTALDVTTQEQMIDLLRERQQASRLGLLLITHDLGVVARIADEILVMYAGRAVEYGPAQDIFANPSHPYTRGLLDSVDYRSYAPRERLRSIGGAPPELHALPGGCAFHPRCPHRQDACLREVPALASAPGFRSLSACLVAQSGAFSGKIRQTAEAAR
jgi:oligopeptide/dipeptide ABC transporter ATP-binding protein